MRRYIDSVTALTGHPEVSDIDVEATKRAVKSFMMAEGPKLNQLLIEEDSANRNTSYVSKPWFDMYLESRLPLPLNYSPFMTLKADPNPAMNNQLVKVTNLIVSSMRFFKSLRGEVLAPEVFYTKPTAKSPIIQNLVKILPNTFNLRYMPMFANGAYPLDMGQYGNLLSSTRIPQLGRDELKTFENSKHVIVIRNGNFYAIDVLDKNFKILSEEKIMQDLNYILRDKAPKPEHEIGYLTTQERDKWAHARAHLLDTGNAGSINVIDSGIFCVVLEDDDCDVMDVLESTKMFLYGDGGSRWFDKSFSLIISGNGETCINFEHSWGDGVAVVRYMNEIYEDTINNPRVKSPEIPETAGPHQVRKLEFTFDDSSKAAISAAKERYIADTSRLKVAGKKYDRMSKEYLKSKKISPDGVLQLSIQIGHRRMYGHPAATYESCSTAAFKHGRTETVRSCSIEAQAAAKFFCEKGLNDITNLQEANKLIRASCKKHNQLTLEAAMGLGFDRHMFGLKNLALRQGTKTANIFEDKMYKLMNHIVLSTSTLDTDSIGVGGFAPVVPDGFGIGYGCRKDHLGCNITSYENRDVDGFVDAVTESFEDIRKVLESE